MSAGVTNTCAEPMSEWVCRRGVQDVSFVAPEHIPGGRAGAGGGVYERMIGI